MLPNPCIYGTFCSHAQVMMEESWHPQGTAELERAWQIVRSEVAASLCVNVKGVVVGGTGKVGGRHACIMALGPGCILVPERVSLTVAIDFDQLSANEENMQSFERVLIQDLCISLRVPRHRISVSRVRPAPLPTPHQHAVPGSASTSCVVVELCVETGTLVEPTARQIAEVCAGERLSQRLWLERSSYTSVRAGGLLLQLIK